MENSRLSESLAHQVGSLTMPLAHHNKAEATAPQETNWKVSRKNLALWKRKRKCHTLVRGASAFYFNSVSLPTSSCHRADSSATRPHTAGLFPSSFQYQSFRRIFVTAFVATSLHPSLLHLHQCALSSFEVGGVQSLYCVSYTSTHNDYHPST